mgnify:CR=1 FL=1|jgi:ribokinase
MAKIIIVGSSNTDLVIKTDKIPMPGETVSGGVFTMAGGGKGANQAVAVARLGGDVSFIAKVGDDLFGRNSIERYKAENMDISHVIKDCNAESGVALITVDEKGENCIAVAPGANETLRREDIDEAMDDIVKSSFILMQLEIPMDTIEYVCDIASRHKIKVILNPAPACKLQDYLFDKIFLFIPNRCEASFYSGLDVNDIQSAREAAKIIHDKGIKMVLITMGNKGSLLYDGRSYTEYKAREVKAVDTTAAGDTFCGALCEALSEGKTMDSSIRFATDASALAVQKMGAQPSIPTRKELNESSKY